MSIGYACLAVGVPNTSIKGCLLKNANDEKLAELIRHNLTSLKNIIEYNDANNVRLFRISSDIIPFGSSPANALQWRSVFKEEISRLGSRVRKAGIRVSMHPGQYTVLNSSDKQVAERAVDDLAYHSALMDSLEVDFTNKIILHVGGAYGNKKEAMMRFSERYKDLDDSIKRRLVIENDDKAYHIGDVMELGSRLGIPVVYDNLHNKVNCCDPSKKDYYWISQCSASWKHEAGRQKVHYSQQDLHKSSGSHSESISVAEFLDFFAGLGENKPDIMLEVKDKNLSAIKCINCTTQSGNIKTLELEWSRYKYAVLEKSPNDYKKIRQLLKDKSSYPVIEFYQAIEHAYAQEAVTGNGVNAALHVWGYFKGMASTKEKERFFNLLRLCQESGSSMVSLKRFLFKLADKYKQGYLVNSYYFI